MKALRVLALRALVLALELRVAVAYPTRYIRNDVTTRVTNDLKRNNPGILRLHRIPGLFVIRYGVPRFVWR